MFSKTGPKWCDLNSLPAAPTAVEETVALGWFFFFSPHLISLILMESLQRKLFQEQSKTVKACSQIFPLSRKEMQKPKAMPWRIKTFLSLV